MNICLDIKQLIEANLPSILQLRNEKSLKPDNSYVSAGDIFCEEIIINYVKEKLPNFLIISEETPIDLFDHNSNKNVIIIDPIDGTENFISGLKEWGIAICIYKDGNHFQSMLAMPELNLFLISGDKIKKNTSRIVGISSSLTKEDILKLRPGFEYRIIGCCVYNMYNVITGSYFSFENPKGAYIWDIIPGLNLALENGLSVTVNNKNYHGELLEPNKKYIFSISQE